MQSDAFSRSKAARDTAASIRVIPLAICAAVLGCAEPKTAPTQEPSASVNAAAPSNRQPGSDQPSSVHPTASSASPQAPSPSSSAVSERTPSNPPARDTDKPPASPMNVRFGNLELSPARSLGPSMQAAAGPHSAWLINADNQVLVARIPESGEMSVPALVSKSGGRAPVVAEDALYWVRNNTLQRQLLRAPSQAPETLAADAYPGTRVSALRVEAGGQSLTLLAYIAQSALGSGPTARLVVRAASGALTPPLALTEGETSALSVQLTRTARGNILALWLDARTGITTVHTRELRVEPRVTLGREQVVWAGGTAQALTELSVTQSSQGTVAFVALEQDASHFGLARLELPDAGGEALASWTPFANGLSPVPVVSARVCGHTWISFSMPKSAAPKAPAVLVLARLDAQPWVLSPAIAEAREIRDLSIAEQETGALLVYVTDTHTHALQARCIRRVN